MLIKYMLCHRSTYLAHWLQHVTNKHLLNKWINQWPGVSLSSWGLTFGTEHDSCPPSAAALSGHCYLTRSDFFFAYAFGSDSVRDNSPGYHVLRNGTFVDEASRREAKADGRNTFEFLEALWICVLMKMQSHLLCLLAQIPQSLCLQLLLYGLYSHLQILAESSRKSNSTALPQTWLHEDRQVWATVHDR